MSGTAIGIRNGHRIAPRGQTDRGLGGLAVAPCILERGEAICSSGNGTIRTTEARHVRHLTTNAHDPDGDDLVRSTCQYAGIATDNTAEVAGLGERSDGATGKVTAGLTYDIRPIQTIGTDLPLVGGRRAKGGMRRGSPVPHDGRQHVVGFGAYDIPGHGPGTDRRSVVGDAIVQQIGRVGPYHDTGLILIARPAGVQRPLRERDVIGE